MAGIGETSPRIAMMTLVLHGLTLPLQLHAGKKLNVGVAQTG